MKNQCHSPKKENFNKTDKSEENNNKNSLLLCNLKRKKLNLQAVNTLLQQNLKYHQSKKTLKLKLNNNVKKLEIISKFMRLMVKE